MGTKVAVGGLCFNSIPLEFYLSAYSKPVCAIYPKMGSCCEQAQHDNEVYHFFRTISFCRHHALGWGDSSD